MSEHAEAQVTGLVETGRNNIFTVATADATLLCRLKGKRLELDERSYSPLAPGDRVVVGDIDPAQGTGTIEQRLPRRNAFSRFNRKRNVEQTLAANVDRVACITSIAQPQFRPRFVDRFLALAEYHQIEPILVLNKIDLQPASWRRVADFHAELGYSVIPVSAEDGSGMDELAVAIRAGRTALVGQSGVGKSSLLNRLAGESLQLTRKVSARYLRGRHTTNAARLFRVSGMEIIDTPGIRELDVGVIPGEELARCFRDIVPAIGDCVHADCSHIEEDGCAVRSSVDSGALAADRYDSYRRLFAEITALERE